MDKPTQRYWEVVYANFTLAQLLKERTYLNKMVTAWEKLEQDNVRFLHHNSCRWGTWSRVLRPILEQEDIFMYRLTIVASLVTHGREDSL